ncbi:glycoside hydrolase family 13 protein [Rothia terrae]|jgi:oligo-1,6-glucosidase|uniref:Alpha-glucosidase n=1 Tax=Rothia terrae TaxID=396015 RepID=A0A7H2BFB5_9MICC|nr:alpha-glucosidase [Rothia terrae]QNV38361.1 alpha-glucosidase [Rothia terrae]
MSNAGKQWWKEAVVYQVWPRSFQDSNGDGIGDIPGITSRIPYLSQLGINVIWLSPVFGSPNDDMGYDISDYYSIMDEFGTMADFDELLETAHNHGIKILMDMVANHTSDEHEWFVQSRASTDNPYRDFYYWRDSSGVDDQGNPLPPNNWGSEFGGRAWEYDENTDQWYMHIFSKKQPDLNWENPKVREAIYEMTRWWLDKGIDGFRLDAINIISKPEGLPDDPSVDPDKHSSSIPFVIHNGTKVHEWMHEMNAQAFSRYDCMTVGEMSATPPSEALGFAGFETDELNMIFHFEHMGVDSDPGAGMGKWSLQKYDLRELKKVLNAWQTELDGKAWGSLYWNNHDQPRVVSRFGNDSAEYREVSAKMLATVLHFMQGTPYIYQGEEFGMTNVKFPSISDYRDLDSLNMYDDFVTDRGSLTPVEGMELIYAKGRDNARTPVQWDSSAHGGFSTGTPWIDVNPNFTEINAQAALDNPDSLFYYYQRLISLRRGELQDHMVYASFKPLDAEDSEVYAYERHASNGEKLLVIANFTDHDVERSYELADGRQQLVISNYSDDAGDTLRPYEAKVYKISD